jgi:hypothetical protein
MDRTTVRSSPAGASSSQSSCRVPRTREVWAFVARTHRDHDIGSLEDLRGPRLRELIGDVDASLTHRYDNRAVEGVRGVGAARSGDRGVANVMGEEAESHLRAAGVVDTEEENDRPGPGAGR